MTKLRRDGKYKLPVFSQKNPIPFYAPVSFTFFHYQSNVVLIFNVKFPSFKECSTIHIREEHRDHRKQTSKAKPQEIDQDVSLTSTIEDFFIMEDEERKEMDRKVLEMTNRIVDLEREKEEYKEYIEQEFAVGDLLPTIFG